MTDSALHTFLCANVSQQLQHITIQLCVIRGESQRESGEKCSPTHGWPEVCDLHDVAGSPSRLCRSPSLWMTNRISSAGNRRFSCPPMFLGCAIWSFTWHALSLGCQDFLIQPYTVSLVELHAVVLIKALLLVRWTDQWIDGLSYTGSDNSSISYHHIKVLTWPDASVC